MADQPSEIVARILENLGSLVLNEISWITGLRDELQSINQTLLAINAVLIDAEDQQSTSKSMKHWLQNLKSVAYDIEDVLDLISTQSLELKANGRSLFRKITRLFTDYDIVRELKAIRKKLDEIEYNRRSFSLEERHTVPLHAAAVVQRETYSYVRGSHVIGRKEDKERIISLLFSSGHDADFLSVIPLIGIGGMGKTTLARLIINDPAVEARFDLRLWAHVSNKFVLKTLIANIMQAATGQNFNHLNMESLQNIFREKLGGQTYLLILDDVWISDPKEWIELKEFLVIGSPRSRIIVTTREERVAFVTGTTEPYRLKGLSNDECWSIFAECAFNRGEHEAFPLLVEVGKSIVQKCQGVPLAAKTLGSVLHGERDYSTWKRIEESELWEIEQGPNDILPALKLSHDQIPRHLRSCFALCACKKGFPLLRMHLINMWSALGLLHSREGTEDVEAIGDRYVNDLLSRSFFQFPGHVVMKYVITNHGEVFDEWSSWYKLAHMFKNNLVEDKDVVYKEAVLLDDKVISLEMHDLLHDLATYVSEEDTVIMNSYKKEISPKVRHIMWDHEDLSRKELPVCVQVASKARVFSFIQPMGLVNKSFLKGLLSYLKCLRVLNLSNSDFEELPDSVGDLKHLRYLNLSRNSKLIRLPQSTCKLVNLQSLDVFRCPELEDLPKDIHKLVSLQCLNLTLKFTRLPDEGIYQLKSLQNLKLWYSMRLKYLSEDIGNLKNLRHLLIISCPKIASLPNDMKLLTNLEELRLLDCRNLDLEGWEGLYGLRSLKYLDLRMLPKLLTFPNGLESIAGSLQYFRIEKCHNMRTMPKRLQPCSSLLRLSLINCPSLTALPGDMHATKSLQVLNIEGCPELSQRCQKDTGIDWHLISQIPEIVIDHQVIQKENSTQLGRSGDSAWCHSSSTSAVDWVVPNVFIGGKHCQSTLVDATVIVMAIKQHFCNELFRTSS